MVAREKHLGHPLVPKGCGTSVLRVLEQAVAERLVLRALLVPKCTGKQAHRRVGHGQGRKLASGKNVVTKRDDLVGQAVDPLVHALVAPAHEDDALHVCQALGRALGERSAAGREEDHVCRGLVHGLHGLDGLEDGLGLHEHALPAAKGGVIYGAVAVVGPRAQIVRVKREDAPRLRASEYGGAHVAREDLRYD